MDFRPGQDRWLPLLVLNSTSVTTGQRIITTALAATYDLAVEKDDQKNDSKKDQKTDPCPTTRVDTSTSEPNTPSTITSTQCSLFIDASRFHDLLKTPPKEGSGGTAEQVGPSVDKKDIDLSMAVLNSARFPIASPPGEIRDANDRLVDGIVDGGYFENFGMQTATELALALRAVDPTLDPFILVITNDPAVPALSNVQRHGFFNRDRITYLTDLSTPITTFRNTRNARGTLAFDEARASLSQKPPPYTCNMAQIGVVGEWREKRSLEKQKNDECADEDSDSDGEPSNPNALKISMSWWLSKPLQRLLSKQTQCTGNQEAIRVLLNALDVDVPIEEGKEKCPFDVPRSTHR
jgi:hypothetical protein